MPPAKPHRVHRSSSRRQAGSSAAFALLLVAGLAAAFSLSPGVDVALAAGAAWGVFLLLVVAAWDLLALATSRFAASLAWLPRLPLPAWMNPLRSSFVVVAFFYGILAGHFFWR